MEKAIIFIYYPKHIRTSRSLPTCCHHEKSIEYLTHLHTDYCLPDLFAGITLTYLGGYDLVLAFTHSAAENSEHFSTSVGRGLLTAVDLFLIAIVSFVFAIGLTVLVNAPDTELPFRLPSWLRIKTFIPLKAILWEAILTTLVIAILNGLIKRQINNETSTYESLVIPASILVISLSLFLLKRADHGNHN